MNNNRRTKPRSRRRLLLESLLPRFVLTGPAIAIDIDAATAAEPRDFVQVGDVAYFTAQNAASGRELWKTDGTEAGTSLVADIRPGTGSSLPQQLTEFNGNLFFVADDGTNGEELWMSDGTASGTTMIRDINAGTGYQYPYGDGPLQSFPRSFTEFNGELFFSAEDQTDGAELWKTNGTTSGTVQVVDIVPGSFTDANGTYPNASSPQDLTAVGNTLFFSADDGVNGRELWKTDGTSSGTSLVRDIAPGTYTYYNNGYNYGQYPNQSDPRQLAEFNGVLYFVAKDSADNTELWRSDGTNAGTAVVAEIGAGTIGALSVDDALATFDGRLYFAADDGISGKELFSTNGTASGTQQETNLNSGTLRSIDSFEFAVTGEAIYFVATNGSTGNELYRQTASGIAATLVSDINVGVASSNPTSLTTVGDRVFFSATTSTDGTELWESDGTFVGTLQVANLASGTASSSPGNLFNLNGQLLFSANAGSGLELFSVDTDAVNNTKNATLTVFVDSQEVAIPANIGVDSSGNSLSSVRSTTSGDILISPITDESVDGITLGDFFQTYRTNAGVAGNNSSATFDDDELFGNTHDASNTVKMFVNGQVNEDFDNYVIQDGDDIVIVYGDNPVISLNTNFGPVLFELFEDATPITVQNFLNYINDGDYINSFFHRSVNNFVIQGGGFTTTSTTFTSTAQFGSVPTDATIQNEFGISNTRGTVAMAKLGGDPNSATSQFFVNLSDSNTFLDSVASGEFTVFAQVLGLTNVDAIAALPIDTSNGSPYGELPLSVDNQLVVVQSVEGLSRFSGVKFIDTNANGIQDAGESGIGGVTIYFDNNSNGVLDVGERSTITDSSGQYLLEADAGTYTIRAEITPGTTDTSPNGRYIIVGEIGIEASGLDFGESALNPPTSVDLVSASDTGAIDTDNLTRLNNSTSETVLSFDVTGVTNGAEVRIFNDGVLIGSAIATSSVARVQTNGNTLIGEGTRTITATQLLGNNETEASPSLSINIDSTPPTGFTNTAPDVAQAGQLYTVDINSPDEGGAGLTYSIDNAPTGMTINSSGVVSWTPTVDQAVPQSFTIQLTDEAGNSASQTVDLTVLGVIPAFPDEYSITEDGSLAIDAATGVLANDGDGNSGVLTASVVAQASSGTVVLSTDGSFTYTPNANFFGTDSFTYQATNGTDISNVARVVINVTAVNDSPNTSVDNYTATEDTPLTISVGSGVLANDIDVDGDALTVTLATQAANGSVALNSGGSFTYTPSANFNGADSFTYTASDGTSVSSPVTVSLTVVSVNDTPISNIDSYSTSEDTVLTIAAETGVLANDTDADTTSLTASIGSLPSNGTVVLNADGSFTYTPNANFNGSDSFTYTASDSVTSGSVTTVNVSVAAVADPPTAVSDSFNASEQTVSFDVLANDSTTPDVGQTLTITSVTQGSSGGLVAINGSVVNYTAATGFVGTETFTYTVTDTDGLTDTTTVSVVVEESADNALSGFVLLGSTGANSGVPGVVLTVSGTDNQGNAVSQTVLTGADGSYMFDELPSGTYSLTQSQPTALVDGSVEMAVPGAISTTNQLTNVVLSGGTTYANNNFIEQSLDVQFVSMRWFFASTVFEDMLRETLASAEASVGNTALADAILNGSTTIETPANTAPIAIDDAFSTPAGVTLSVPAGGVLTNDVDSASDVITATTVTLPVNGSLTLATDGSFTYVPNTNFVGTDTFTYRVTDAQGLVDTATAVITVTATPNEFSVTENSAAATIVGSLTTATDLGSEVVFEVINQAQGVALDLAADDHISGNPSGSVILIEYVDFQCPVCATFHPILQQLEQDFADDLMVVRRHLPLESIHFNARAAAIASEAAANQGAFDEFADLLFDNQSEWEFDSAPSFFFEGYASQLGLNLTQFQADVQDSATSDRVQRDIDAATGLGNTSTPTFYLEGQLIANPADQSAFESLIQSEVNQVTDVFAVNRQTGVISVRDSASLDFETTAAFQLTVQATGSNGFTESINATINVINVAESTAEGESISATTGSLELVQDAVDQIFAAL